MDGCIYSTITTLHGYFGHPSSLLTTRQSRIHSQTEFLDNMFAVVFLPFVATSHQSKLRQARRTMSKARVWCNPPRSLFHPCLPIEKFSPWICTATIQGAKASEQAHRNAPFNLPFCSLVVLFRRPLHDTIVEYRQPAKVKMEMEMKSPLKLHAKGGR